MNAITKHEKGLDGHYFQVRLDGKKFPEARGEWYTVPGSYDYEAAERLAVEYAEWEQQGKYLSSCGEFWESEEAYDEYLEGL